MYDLKVFQSGSGLIFIRKGDAPTHPYLSLDPHQAEELRDKLNILLPAKKSEGSEYKVQRNYEGSPPLWDVYQEVPTTKVEVACTSRSELQAKAIAKALNEAEGL